MNKPIKLRRAKNKQWYFTVNAANGKVLVTSETYHRRAGALNAIRALAAAFAWVQEGKGPTEQIEEDPEEREAVDLHPNELVTSNITG